MGAAVNSVKTNVLTGIHVPSLTWFLDDSTQEIDWDLQRKHIQFLVESGVDGSECLETCAMTWPNHANHDFAVVIAGTNGEAVTLSRDEKSRLVQLTRESAVASGRPELPIGLGTSGQCTRDIISETKLAAEAGANYALVLTPSYFHFAMTTDAIAAFFEDVAEASPLPLVIYNFPGVAAGLDLDSDLLIRLGKSPNIAGVKLTCGGIAKVARIADAYAPEQFFALAGQSDWLIPALSVGGTGCITGIANLYPKVTLFPAYV